MSEKYLAIRCASAILILDAPKQMFGCRSAKEMRSDGAFNSSSKRKRCYVSRLITAMEHTREVTFSLFLFDEQLFERGIYMIREIKIHCRKDRKGLRMAYTPTGDDNAIVLQGITIACPYCKEARSLHRKTEKEFLSQVVDGKFFI